MNADRFSSLVSSYVFSPGRRIVTAQTILNVATDQGDDVLVQQAEDAIAFDRDVWAAQQSWAINREIREGTRVSLRAIDQQLDRNISGIHGVAQNHVHSLEAGDEQYDISQQFIEEFFPNGAAPITRLYYEDQLLAVEAMLVRWKTDWKDRLEKLALGALVRRTETLLVDYRAAVTIVARRDLSWDDVRAMDTEGQENMLALIIRVCGIYNSKSQADIDMRNRYLATFFDQTQRIAAIRKRTPVVPDIDPDTGDELEPSNDSETTDLQTSSETVDL